MKFKQAIKIGTHIDDIMRLPCVFSCHKEKNGELCYLLYDWDDSGNYIKAYKGDWLCEGYDGRWHRLTNKEYEQKGKGKTETGKG